MRRLAVLAAAVSLASCATTKPDPRRAKIVQTSVRPTSCAPLGPIRGRDTSIEVGKSWEYMQHEPSRKAALDAALDEAAAMGATHAYIEGKPQPLANGYVVEGFAYDCSSQAAPASEPAAPDATPAAASGCGKDTDCKGDRICRNHECVDP